MFHFLNQKKGRRYSRLFLGLLLMTISFSLLSGTGYSESAILELNSSGNRNVALAVDPIRKNEGFSAVLYNNSNGMPTSEANAVAQTADGFLWIGSYAGLIRYDGTSFERFDPSSGPANVRCLFVDSRDRLWIGSNDAGLLRMEEGDFRKWDKADGLPSLSIREIAEDENGLIYIAEANGGIGMVNSEDQFIVLQAPRLDNQTIQDIRLGPDGLIYGLTQTGDLFTLKNGEVVTFLSRDECRVKNIVSILPDPTHPGNLYLGTATTRIYYGNLERNFIAMSLKEAAPLYNIDCMESINGEIWVCATNGIGKLDSGGFHQLKNVPMDNTVEHMITDYEGNLWFTSSRQGLMKIVPNRFSDISERYGLSEVVVNSTCLKGRQLFIGTDSGLIILQDGKEASRFPLSKAVTASGEDLGTSDLLEYLDGVRIRSIIRDSKERLWISTWRKYGLLCYDRGELTAFTPKEGLYSDRVRVVYECEDGRILVANTGGVSIIEDGVVTAGYGEKDGIINSEILTVTEGFHHEIILGSDGDGIYIITSEGIRHIGLEEGLKSEIVMRIKQSPDRGFYWIVTGNSLAFMTPDYHVTTIENFPFPNNYDLYENSKGDLWVPGSNGIYVIPSESFAEDGAVETVFFGIPNGLPYVATSNSYSEQTAEGDLYLAGTEGVVKVNINLPFDAVTEMKTAMPYVSADGVRFYPDASGSFNVPGNARKLTVYPHVFNYALIDPQISYRLEGFDPTDITVSRSELKPVDYTNLSLGTYSFVMTLKDPIGNTEQTSSFRIVKGREISAGTSGTVILDIASLFMMGGILIYTSLYRRRGGLEDRLFFFLILSNVGMTIGELLSYTLEYSELPFSGWLMIAGNTVFYCSLVFFPYLLAVYLDYHSDPDSTLLRKRKVLLGIPCLLFFLLMLINLKTGWIFSVGRDNIYNSGILTDRFWLPILPVCFYSLVSLVKMAKASWNLAGLSLLLILCRMVWDFWYQAVSSTSFLYTLFLVCIHIYVMNHPIYEEASKYDR